MIRKERIFWIGRHFVLVILFAGLAACAGHLEKAEGYATQDEWMKAVIEYRKAYGGDPTDIELKLRLKQAELKAADYYYQRGFNRLERDDLNGAIAQFQQGLLAMPDHSKLLQAMNQALAQKEARDLYEQARQEAEAGKKDEAINLLKKGLDVFPDDKLSAGLLQQLQKQTEEEQDADKLVLSSRAPITINFRQTDLRTGFEFIAKSFGVDVIFDDAVKSAPVTLFAKDVTFEQAISLMLATTRTFYRKIGPNTILIAPDTKEKRGQYEDQLVRTYHLTSVRAKDMADILKGLITIKKIVINEQLNTLTLRDSTQVLHLAEKIIDSNDHKPAEMILDVELLEVNRTKAEQLGLDLDNYAVSVGIPSTASILVGQPLRPQLQAAATLTLPNATFQFYKQDVDAKTLANPKIRVLNGKTAKILIGDRVPLQSATIVDATGQTRTTYDYKDVGIKLIAEPTINLDNSTTVKLSLEVSTLGANLGSPTNPAYEIGTRSADTFMLLRDGETAILGGLIQDVDSNSHTRIPILGDIPVLGSLFTSYNDSTKRSDILLTITPRIIRGWDLPAKQARAFYSGTENNYQDEPLFQSLAARKPPAAASTATVAAATGMPAVAAAGATSAAGVALDPTPASPKTGMNGAATPSVQSGTTNVQPPNSVMPAIPPAATAAQSTGPAKADSSVLPGATAVGAKAGTNPTSTVPAATPPVAPVATSGAPPVPPTSTLVLAFSEPVYESGVGQELEIQLVANNVTGVTDLPIEILFNPQLLRFVRGEAGADFKPQDFKVDADASKGLLTVRAKFDPSKLPNGSGVLAHIVLQGQKPGVAYLVYRAPSVRTAAGNAVTTQMRAARVVIK